LGGMRGTMAEKFFVPPGHFYSPWPDKDDAARHLEKIGRSGLKPLQGVAIDDERIKDTWNTLLPFMRTAPFQDDANAQHRYHRLNDFYSYGDGTVYYGLIAQMRPKRIIEIGSGFSSALALDARDHLGLNTHLTFIEPYPTVLKKLLRPGDEKTVTLLQQKVQHVDLSHFEALEAGDILFVDSSHVVKTGSDVCFEVFDILPVLNPGVLIHFHDVFHPFEYPGEWVLKDQRAWNELYLLRAFLMYNSRFDVVRFPELAADPSTPFARNCGGGLWMVKRAEN
jgi:predicted O-methyltransferase YrrM